MSTLLLEIWHQNFFYQVQSWLWSCKQGHHFCACTRVARPCGPVFSVSCCSVGSLYVFPQNTSLAYQALHLGHELQGQKRSCSRGVTPPCSFPLTPVCHGSSTSLNAAPLQNVLNDNRGTVTASPITWSVAPALSCFIQIFWVLMGVWGDATKRTNCFYMSRGGVDRGPCCWSLEAIKVKQA